MNTTRQVLPFDARSAEPNKSFSARMLVTLGSDSIDLRPLLPTYYPYLTMKLIMGLGNPGNQYAHSRHNIGFMCVSLDKEEEMDSSSLEDKNPGEPPGALMPLRDDMGEWGDMKTFVIVSLRSTRQLKWIPGSRPEDDNFILEAANKNHLSVSKGEVRDRHVAALLAITTSLFWIPRGTARGQEPRGTARGPGRDDNGGGNMRGHLVLSRYAQQGI